MRWLVLVVAVFGLPLFVGLDKEDIREDEAIYSFAVDLILETGDWLQPRSIPNEAFPFLEKPPLKFWIIAAPMKLGLLPHDEFGMRFWDALGGAISFVYVFLIGSALLGPVCGAVAVLVLFAHEPLLFAHGLRGNNMDAPLVLAYCGAMYHFMAWARTGSAFRRNAPRLHALAVGLYFVLGFMTKFVAVLFLPMILVAAAAIVPEYRRKLQHEWALWMGVIAVAFALTTPWFVWAWRRHGDLFVRQMFQEAVVTRMTSYLDPVHVQPWYFYAAGLHRWLSGSGTFVLAVAGVIVLGVQTARRKWPEGVLILLWMVLPIVAISLGTSKLYHYTYPFLPPIALAAGYVAALALAVGPAPVARILAKLNPRQPAMPAVSAALARPAVRATLLAIAFTAFVIAVVTIVTGPIRITIGSTDVFKSSGIFRPLIVVVVCGLLADVGRTSARHVTLILVLSTLPFPAYRYALGRLNAGEHRMRTARDCLVRLEATTGGSRGMYIDLPPENLPHSHYYYFRAVRPWTWSDYPGSEELLRYLDDPREQRPVLAWNSTLQHFSNAQTPTERARASIGRIVMPDSLDRILLLLPGPYGVCRPGQPDPRAG
jgi:4-amino-4-deoxy-L-arabinose transferase-like glycosyltransferase